MIRRFASATLMLPLLLVTATTGARADITYSGSLNLQRNMDGTIVPGGTTHTTFTPTGGSGSLGVGMNTGQVLGTIDFGLAPGTTSSFTDTISTNTDLNLFALTLQFVVNGDSDTTGEGGVIAGALSSVNDVNNMLLRPSIDLLNAQTFLGGPSDFPTTVTTIGAATFTLSNLRFVQLPPGVNDTVSRAQLIGDIALAVPEPSSLALAAIGGLGLTSLGLRRARGRRVTLGR